MTRSMSTYRCTTETLALRQTTDPGNLVDAGIDALTFAQPRASARRYARRAALSDMVFSLVGRNFTHVDIVAVRWGVVFRQLLVGSALCHFLRDDAGGGDNDSDSDLRVVSLFCR